MKKKFLFISSSKEFRELSKNTDTEDITFDKIEDEKSINRPKQSPKEQSPVKTLMFSLRESYASGKIVLRRPDWWSY